MRHFPRRLGTLKKLVTDFAPTILAGQREKLQRDTPDNAYLRLPLTKSPAIGFLRVSVTGAGHRCGDKLSCADTCDRL
jgi:hypothetical protein